MRKTFITLTVVFAGTGAAQAVAPIYDSTTSPRYYRPTDTQPVSYNVNSTANGGDITRILYDDVPIFTGSVVNPSVNVTSVRFDIVRFANAPAVTISGFWSPMELDAAHDGGPGDLSDDDPNSRNSIGAAVSLPANGPNAVVVPIYFTTPFNTGTLNNTQSPTGSPRFFNLGLAFNETSGKNGWEVSDNPDNIDTLWDYESPTDVSEFSLGEDSSGHDIIGVMATQVFGTLVPEPGSIAFLGGLGAMLIRRRPLGR